MGDSYKGGPVSRDVEQGITVLKKGATLLKYGRRGKPKFCPFRLSNDESALIWYCEKEEKLLKLSHVSRIIPGQRTAVFQRYPRPDKEYQSFSLIYGDRSLDLICKDKDEAEVWFVALEALISKSSLRKWRNETRDGSSSTDSSTTRRSHRSLSSLDGGDAVFQAPTETTSQTGLWKALSNIILHNSSFKPHNQSESSTNLVSLGGTSVNNSAGQSQTSDNTRVSLSSAVSSSSHGSGHDDFDPVGDIFIWGDGIGEGILGGGNVRIGDSHDNKYDALLPMALETAVVLDVKHLACGDRHAVLVTKQGEIFSWGEEAGGRLGHGIEVDVSVPKLINNFNGNNVELVACGEYHTCAVTTLGDLFTWGDGTFTCGMLGHGSEVGHWIPKRVCGPLDGRRVSYVSCGPWHTAVVVSTGQLFTFGDGTFGVLGHGDRISYANPREVEALRGLRTVRVACGTWHTAAVVEVDVVEAKSFSVAGKLFTWGEGDKGQLGHCDKGVRLVPEVVAALRDVCFCKVACGCDLTVALATSGRVYTMGSAVYGQLGCADANEVSPACVGGKIIDSFIEDIACGSHHVAVLTSKAELYTWGKGTNGQLGHGDTDHRSEPTFVDFMKDKLVKRVVCGSNFTAVVCFHNWVYGADYSTCTGCHNPFGMRRKRHHCYNCGLVFCKVCSNHKSLKASLAPNMNKPYRVCDDCFVKLSKVLKPGNVRIPRPRSRNSLQKSSEVGGEKETLFPKFSDLPFVNSFKRNESGLSKGSVKLGKVGSFPSGNFPSVSSSSNMSSPSTCTFGDSNKRVSASAPGSRRVSRAASPISYWFSPVRSSSLITSHSIPTSLEVMDPNTKNANDNLRQQVIRLKAEVEELTGNNHLLEAELEKTRKQLKEAKAVATEEAEKSKAAREVIKSLTSQLKEMTERAPEGNMGSKFESFGNNHLTSLLSPRSESNILTMDTNSINGGKEQTEVTEWVVQDEPGVYITLCSLVGGGNELKRVRFSRKLFSEEEAEKWWGENSVGVFERHNIRSQAV